MQSGLQTAHQGYSNKPLGETAGLVLKSGSLSPIFGQGGGGVVGGCMLLCFVKCYIAGLVFLQAP